MEWPEDVVTMVKLVPCKFCDRPSATGVCAACKVEVAAWNKKNAKCICGGTAWEECPVHGKGTWYRDF